jgi:hypothetical protein
MKKILFLVCFGLLIYSCAPVTKCKPYKYQNVSIPQDFTTEGYVSYGILKYPFSLVKAKDNYTLETFIGNLSFKKDLCFGSGCINLPIDLSKLFYGDVIAKDDKVLCKDGYTIYESENGVYKKMVYVKDGKLYKMDILDNAHNKEFSVYFKDRSKAGYYKNLEIKADNLDLNINIKDLKSV